MTIANSIPFLKSVQAIPPGFEQLIHLLYSPTDFRQMPFHAQYEGYSTDYGSRPLSI